LEQAVDVVLLAHGVTVPVHVPVDQEHARFELHVEDETKVEQASAVPVHA
jgi:hypothetical protein